jgi:hypothetical protein
VLTGLGCVPADGRGQDEHHSRLQPVRRRAQLIAEPRQRPRARLRLVEPSQHEVLPHPRVGQRRLDGLAAVVCGLVGRVHHGLGLIEPVEQAQGCGFLRQILIGGLLAQGTEISQRVLVPQLVAGDLAQRLQGDLLGRAIIQAAGVGQNGLGRAARRFGCCAALTGAGRLPGHAGRTRPAGARASSSADAT